MIPMKFKKIIFLAISVCLSVFIFYGTLFAVPANPRTMSVQQPDGQKIQIKLKGDENFHWNEDANGYLVMKNQKTFRWEYAEQKSDGKLYTTNLVVGKDSPNSKATKASSMNKSLIKKNSLARSKSLSRNSSSIKKVSTIGTFKNLVILVQFSGLSATHTKAEFNSLFNDTGYTTDGALGSVKDFYKETSYNKIDIQSTVTDWITLAHTYDYYGANDSSGNDVDPRAMVLEALNSLNTSHFDFASLDSDGDGWVDGLDVIHSGGGEEYGGNDSNYIWSHNWQLASVFNTWDGKKLQTYHTEPERRGWDGEPLTQGITRIGVICHETGHFLGLPDLYDTDYSSEGVGKFCLMAGGSWNGPIETGGTSMGASPAQMSAWCKEQLGWITPNIITTVGTITIPRVEDDETAVYKIRGNFASSNEYFLIENKQGYGFDTYLPGSSRGLLIWHIDNSQTNNDDETHYLVDLEEASGPQDLQNGTNSGDDFDYFRLGNKTDFTSTSTPNSNSYSSEELGKNITGVSATGNTMTFNVENILFISGYVKRNSSEPISGISVNMTGSQTKTLTTDTNGFYKFSNLLKSESYTLTPTDVNFIFSPASFSVASFSDSLTNQNFWADGPVISLDVSGLNFGVVNGTKTMTINIANTGIGTLIGTITSDVAWAKLSTTTFSGNSVAINVTVAKADLKGNGTYNGTLTISSNGGERTVALKLQATCVLAYPNPYNPRKGKLTFFGSGVVNNDTKIQIMTINGERVKTLRETSYDGSGNDIVVWDGKNEDGREVASGVYLYASTSPKEKYLGKFTVLKKK